MSYGRSRNPFAHILRFVYFTVSALSLVWMLAQYGQVNFISTLILLPAFGYLALHFISLVNLFKKDKFLAGSSVDVLSLGAQKWIHTTGLLLPIPVLLYTAGFAFCVLTYNIDDGVSYNRAVGFSAAEETVFGKSVIWNYLKAPQAPVPASAPATEPDANVRNNVDFQPFMLDMQRRIKKVWFPPKTADSHHTKVAFKVSKEGVISDIKILNHAATEIADQAAIRALMTANPVKPLPSGAPAKVDVEFSFDYNVFDNNGNQLSAADHASD